MKCQIVSLTREEKEREGKRERARLLQPPPRPFKELVTTRGGRECNVVPARPLRRNKTGFTIGLTGIVHREST